jgi:D-alanyl-D-alanine carboxypeptidase/D-alanyl-D-alanine-endopeptidase (penicillin-binding protein 4)
VARGDRRHSPHGAWGRIATAGPIVLVLCVLAAAFASFQYDAAHRLGWVDEPSGPAEISPPQGVDLPELSTPAPVALTLPQSDVDPAKVRAALAPYLSDDDLGRHVLAAVGSPGEGVLFDTRVGAVTPASTMKLLTAVAALESLGPDHTFRTRAVAGDRPRDLVLVGGGDPYLSAEPAKRSDYPPHADLRTLARRTAAELKGDGIARVRLRFDDSLFSGPTASPDWPESYTAEAVVAPITALWADQGAKRDGFGFEPDPSLAAAQVFAKELAKAGVRVTSTPTRSTADVGSVTVASVEGAPLRQVVERVLATSDNEGAELLAHHVGIAEGLGGSFDGGVDGVGSVLERLGVPLRARDVVHDGSGLSRRDRLTAATLLGVLALGADPAHPELRTTVEGLPVAGFNGSLAYRFAKGAAAGRGRVRAKTGTLTGVHGLAGVATDLDGNILTFALIADRVKLEDTLDARDTLDRLASALGACHCSA